MDTEFLTHKVGGVPMVAYIGLGVAGVYGYSKYRAKGSTVPAPSGDAGASSDASSAYGSADGSAGNSGNTSTVSTGYNPSETSVHITTNEEWGRIVSDYLISHGRAPADVTNAITAYLAGKPLSTIQRAIVSMAITAFGVPPTGDVPIIAIPNPAPPSGSPGKPVPGGGSTGGNRNNPPKPTTAPRKGYYWVFRTYDHKWHEVKVGAR